MGGSSRRRKRAANGSTILTPTALSLLLLATLLATAARASPREEEDLLERGWSVAPKCQGTLAECLDDGLEEGPHRRVLYPLHYISYGALKRDTVPCSIRGASYYNCRPGAQAHPYRRGCSAIARCRIY